LKVNGQIGQRSAKPINDRSKVVRSASGFRESCGLSASECFYLRVIQLARWWAMHPGMSRLLNRKSEDAIHNDNDEDLKRA
jgi:hypothetical protein